MKQRQRELLRYIFIGAFLLGIQWTWSAEAFGKSESSPPNSRAITIFVDMSGSTKEARHTIYKEAFDKIYQNLREGDRVVVGIINSRSYIDFKPTVDAEIPKKTLLDNRLQYEKKMKSSREKIQKEVNRLLSSTQGTPLTEILDSLNIVDTIFQKEKERQRILVILSDMIQESRDYNFERERITDEYINRVITYRQRNNLMPKLTGTKVYVVGASAVDSDRFRAIQNFWARYFTKSGADFSPLRYGHSLISFENEP
jgi:hypothetical protein